MKSKIFTLSALAVICVFLASSAYAAGQNNNQAANQVQQQTLTANQGEANQVTTQNNEQSQNNENVGSQTQQGSQGSTGTGNQVQQQTQTANQGEANKIRTQNNEQTQDGQGNGTSAQQGQKGNGEGNQNQIRNEGEENQIQNKENKQNNKGGSENAAQRRSMVANAVQEMLKVADRNGGIGQQVKTIAQTQNQNQEKLEASVEKIQKRSAVMKFFFGPNYGEINNAKKVLAENQEQIKLLNQALNQLVNQGDDQILTEQIQTLTQANLEIQNLLDNSQKGFSLFGWLNKLLSK